MKLTREKSGQFEGKIRLAHAGGRGAGAAGVLSGRRGQGECVFGRTGDGGGKSLGTKSRVRFTGGGLSGTRNDQLPVMDTGSVSIEQTENGLNAATAGLTTGENTRPSTAQAVSEEMVSEILNTVSDEVPKMDGDFNAEAAFSGLNTKMPLPSSKKPRRTLGLAVGLGGSGSVVVHNVKEV